MKTAGQLQVLRLFALLAATVSAGCSAFSTQSAREVSRERLLEISEKGRSDHLKYVGSDFAYHYVYDSRPGVEKTYRVRADSIKLADTFPVSSDDSYVLHPWLIEGKLLGSKPKPEPQ
jgi:hypothetical protein